MTQDSKRSGLASMYMEAMELCNGMETTSYLESYQHSTGDEPPSLLITPNSTSPYLNGATEYTPASSSTRYQWDALYEAWKLVIASPSWRKTSGCDLRELPYIALMGSHQFRQRLKENSQTTAPMTCTCAKKFSLGSLTDTPNPNCV